MHANARRILWTAYIAATVTAWWGAYEFAYTLYERGLISSPIWSSSLGFPIPHHFILGFIGAGISIAAIQWRNRRERKPNVD